MDKDDIWLSILDQQAIGACVVGDNLEIQSCNDHGRRLLGLLDSGHDDNRIRSVAGVTVSSVKAPVLSKVLTIADKRITLSIRSLHGEPGQWILTLVEDRISSEVQTLIQSLGRLSVVGDMASSIAHRFNNTLTVVLGQTELLATRLDLDQRATLSLDRIRAQGNVASDLARRIVSAGRELEMDPVIPDLVEAVELCMNVLNRPLTIDRSATHITIALQLGHLFRVLQTLTETLLADSDLPIAVDVSRVKPGVGKLPSSLIDSPVPWTELTVRSGDAGRSDESSPMLMEDEAYFGLPTTLNRYGAHIFRSPRRFDVYFPAIPKV